MFGKPLPIYLAVAMTGRDKHKLVEEARQDVKIFARYGIKAISPVLEEKVPNKRGKLKTRRKTLIIKWAEDKAVMRRSFCVVDTTADMKSEGVQHETGFMRYALWRPVIRVSPRHDNGYFSIASLEDDIIVGTVEEAAQLIQHKWGTWAQRVKWQTDIISRCSLKFIYDHLKGLFV